MEFTLLDYCAFIGYLVVVVGFAMYMSRKEESSEDYFLAGRKLTWWLIGISLIASNISTEHFVGMAGAGYETGLTVASYEWTAAVAMVLVAVFLLPRFLRRGIYTIPEYLEARYSSSARGLMATFMMVAYVLVIIAAVLYAGAVGLDTVFGESVRGKLGVEKLGEVAQWLTSTPMQWIFGIEPSGANWVMICAVWLIGLIAGLYTVWGGLKAVVWADLFNGLGLIIGGVLVTLLGFLALSTELGDGQGLVEGIRIFFDRAGDKLSAVKPWDDPEVPWIAVFIGGLWIPQFFYWGLNQFIAQRALGAKSVAQGQRGVTFAASLKLLMPFIIIFPGIMAFELYADEISDKDRAYPHMMQVILWPGLRGVMFAALFGAVMSSLDSMLNSASTILTMDLYKRHLKKDASDRSLITLGRVMTALFVVIACLWAPRLGWIAGGKGIFDYIQKTWGFITPGIVTVFVFGLFSRRTPAPAACGAMLLGVPLYAFFLWTMPKVAFLHHMAFTFIALVGYMSVVTLLIPLRDKEESSGASKDDTAGGRSGFLRAHLIPYGTAVIGACLLAQPIFYFSMSCWPDESFLWFHKIPAGAAVGVFVVAALLLLRLPAPAIRRVAALPAEARRAPRFTTAGQLLKVAVVGLAGTIVVGLHVYIFSMEIVKRERTPEDFWQRRFELTVSAAFLSKEAVAVEPIEEEAAEEEGIDPEPVQEEQEEPVEEQGAEEEAVEQEGAEEGAAVVSVYAGPAVIALAAVLAFLAALVMIWWTPVPPEAETPAKTDIDLTPSRLAKVWGVLVILAVVALYWAFF